MDSLLEKRHACRESHDIRQYLLQAIKFLVNQHSHEFPDLNNIEIKEVNFHLIYMQHTNPLSFNGSFRLLYEGNGFNREVAKTLLQKCGVTINGDGGDGKGILVFSCSLKLEDWQGLSLTVEEGMHILQEENVFLKLQGKPTRVFYHKLANY